MTLQEADHITQNIAQIIYQDYNTDLSPQAMLEIIELIKLHVNEIEWDLDPAPNAFDEYEITRVSGSN